MQNRQLIEIGRADFLEMLRTDDSPLFSKLSEELQKGLTAANPGPVILFFKVRVHPDHSSPVHQTKHTPYTQAIPVQSKPALRHDLTDTSVQARLS